MTGGEIALASLAFALLSALVGLIWRAGNKLGAVDTKLESALASGKEVAPMKERLVAVETEQKNLKERVTTVEGTIRALVEPHGTQH